MGIGVCCGCWVVCLSVWLIRRDFVWGEVVVGWCLDTAITRLEGHVWLGKCVGIANANCLLGQGGVEVVGKKALRIHANG